MDAHRISARIARLEWLDRFAFPAQRLARSGFEAAGHEVEDFLHGKFLGQPLHPVLVHLPVGGFLIAALADPFAPSVGTVAILLGVLGSVPAALAGLADWHVYHALALRRIGMAHALLNTVGLGFFILSLLSRGFGGVGFGVLLAYVGFLAVAVSGYLGGLLVYEKKLGTNHAPSQEEEGGFVPVMPLSALAEGKPTFARAGATDVVLVRNGSQVHAFANRCAHQGGPLHEGFVENGCLVCPWHASRFHLDDGLVAQGPSPFSQPKFACRVQAGIVEVQAQRVGQPEMQFETPHGQASVR